MDLSGFGTRIAFVLAIGGLLSAQTPAVMNEPQPAQDLVLHIDVNLVQVDAVVYDRHGHPVTDLKPEDFEILEDGKPQPITAFSYINLNPGLNPGKAWRRVRLATTLWNCRCRRFSKPHR